MRKRGSRQRDVFGPSGNTVRIIDVVRLHRLERLDICIGIIAVIVVPLLSLSLSRRSILFATKRVLRFMQRINRGEVVSCWRHCGGVVQEVEERRYGVSLFVQCDVSQAETNIGYPVFYSTLVGMG
jgi:hypothetical protein